MKLLLDQNLSYRLCQSLRDMYPAVAHVRDVGLATADDPVVWQYAAQHGFTVVSKDGDFNSRAFLFGPPPKIVWIRLGNCSTQDVEALLRRNQQQLVAFEADDEAALLALT